MPCYQSAWQSVKDKKYTWEQLEEAGLVEPCRPGRPPGPFNQAAEAALAKEE